VSEDFVLTLLVAGPLVVALGSLIAAIYFFQRKAPSGQRELWQMVVGAAFLVVSLGIGACYGLVFMSGHG
jgi:hypothetical protein